MLFHSEKLTFKDQNKHHVTTYKFMSERLYYTKVDFLEDNETSFYKFQDGAQNKYHVVVGFTARLLGLGHLLRFLILYTVGRTSWLED
jgi:hypothetical protein